MKKKINKKGKIKPEINTLLKDKSDMKFPPLDY